MREKVEEVMRCKKTWEKDVSRSTEEQTENRHTKEVDKGRAGEKGVYTSRAGEKRYTQVAPPPPPPPAAARKYTQVGVEIVRAGRKGIFRWGTGKVSFVSLFFLVEQKSLLLIFSSAAPRGQPTVKCHPRWQPIAGQQSTVGWGDCWIRTQDCSFTIWCCYQ